MWIKPLHLKNISDYAFVLIDFKKIYIFSLSYNNKIN